MLLCVVLRFAVLVESALLLNLSVFELQYVGLGLLGLWHDCDCRCVFYVVVFDVWLACAFAFFYCGDVC